MRRKSKEYMGFRTGETVGYYNITVRIVSLEKKVAVVRSPYEPNTFPVDYSLLRKLTKEELKKSK